VKRVALSVFHACLFAVFALCAYFYLGIAGAGRLPCWSVEAYNEGGYHFGLVLLGLIPLVFLGLCSVWLAPRPHKWLPFIGLALLCWETAPMFACVPCPFLPQLYWAPACGAFIAMIAAYVTIRQGWFLWHGDNIGTDTRKL
jgi:hypothetical protein